MDYSTYTPHFPRVLDNTILSSFSCPQRTFNEFMVGISRMGISPDLHAGGAFAAALETARYSIWHEHKPLPDALGDAWLTFTREWGIYDPPESNPKTYLAMFHALVDYFREYPPEDDPLRPHRNEDGTPSLEFTFAIPLPYDNPETGEPLLYGGRFDMLAEMHGGDLCVLDEKTTKSFYRNWADKWKMRGQFLGYVWAAQQYGMQCNHFAVRGIAIQKTQVQHLQAGPIAVPDHMLHDWYVNMTRKVERMIDIWHRMTEAIRARGDGSPALYHAQWDRTYGEECDSYGGCQFIDLCTKQDPSQDYTLFARRKWDPTEKDPSGASTSPIHQGLAGMTLAELSEGL